MWTHGSRVRHPSQPTHQLRTKTTTSQAKPFRHLLTAHTNSYDRLKECRTLRVMRQGLGYRRPVTGDGPTQADFFAHQQRMVRPA